MDFVSCVKRGYVLVIVVKLVMDRIANRPRGFAFLQYKTEEESNKAVEGMHGKVQYYYFSIFIVSETLDFDTKESCFLEDRCVLLKISECIGTSTKNA